MSPSLPLLWINLNRMPRRRARMQWAIKQGGWQAQRFEAIDAADPAVQLLALPNLAQIGQALPGLRRWQEANPWRRTSRQELACLASWQRSLLQAELQNSEWVLVMEDDVGSALAAVASWPIQLEQLVKLAPPQTLAIQLAPISAVARQQLHQIWQTSGGRQWLLPKSQMRSHGNGAVLLHRRALPHLIPRLARFCAQHLPHWHPLQHPWGCRPVADKWLYACLPSGSCQVLTYPLFCLDASTSSLHSSHVQAYHQPSRHTTLAIWAADGHLALINTQHHWDAIAGDG
jgi:hypothetical protein